MSAWGWVVAAYGCAALVLGLYTYRLVRRLRQASAQEDREVRE